MERTNTLHRQASAGTRVFAVPELAEKILSLLGPNDLFRAQEINRDIFAATETAKSLRQILWSDFREGSQLCDQNETFLDAIGVKEVEYALPCWDLTRPDYRWFHVRADKFRGLLSREAGPFGARVQRKLFGSTGGVPLRYMSLGRMQVVRDERRGTDGSDQSHSHCTKRIALSRPQGLNLGTVIEAVAAVAEPGDSGPGEQEFVFDFTTGLPPFECYECTNGKQVKITELEPEDF